MRIRQNIARVGIPAWRYIRWIVPGACVACAALYAALQRPMDTRHYVAVGASPQVLDRDGKLLYAFLNDDEQWQFARPLGEISPYLIDATIAVEDQRYWKHAGVDPYAVARAVIQNVTRARIHSGASTITMQVVKQADNSHRTLRGKVSQAWQALRLDWHANKDEILDAYLNGAPYGLNLVGCEAAARRYFGKPANELTLAEAATLAGLPKSPVGLMPLKLPDAARARRDFVLDRMAAEGYITADDNRRAKAEPLVASWHEFPQLAPHLAMRLAANAQSGDGFRTTIDCSLQERAERVLAESLKQFDHEVTNAAAMIVDTETASVLARVGSADFYGTPGGGQVDGCRAPRSPGSALKPFTYALGLERNVLYSTEMLLDESLDYGLYNPENYDGKYRGLVSATYALRRSLNVPAVTVLDRLGYDELQSLLTSAGITTLVKPADYYGLGLTLGNCEIRLDELTAAYCALANLGEYRALRETDAPAPPARRILSRGTCLALYSMLEQEFPNEFQRDVVRAQGYLPRVCWKTGTSTGNHDAWAFVFNRQYVVGVWLGNNDARASKYLVGARAALPLAARIFRSLPKRTSPDWPDFNEDTRQATICADSGLPAAPWCPHTTAASIPQSQFLNRRCDVHYPRAAAGSEVTQRWPASAKGWDLAKVNASIDVLPDSASRKRGLKILTPTNNAEFVLANESNADRIRVRSSADSLAEIHWYLDGEHLGTTGPGKTLFLDLTEGRHKLTCMSPSGLQDSTTFLVERPHAELRFRTAQAR